LSNHRLIYQRMTNIDDQYYINLVIGGDRNAFAALVDQYKDMVFTLALKMVKNREEAEEVAQDTFIKVYKSLAKFKGESKFSTWLYKVAYNTCLDRLKKHNREQSVVTIDEYTNHEITTISNIFDNIEAKERKRLVQRCLDLLPGEDSFLLTLYYFEEQSVKEISKIIGISTNHVKIRLFRSRKKLTAVLKDHLEPEILKYYENEPG
jgi:RNA polymerase sigma factor (sigma-70 family)